MAWKWMPCWKASSLCSGTRESQPSSTRLYRFFTGMAAGGRPAASGRGPAGHPRRQRPAPRSPGAGGGDGDTGLPVPEPGRVLNERPRVRAGPRPPPRRHWPQVPSCDAGGGRREPALPAAAAPPRPAPPLCPADPGEGTAFAGPCPAGAARRFPQTERRRLTHRRCTGAAGLAEPSLRRCRLRRWPGRAVRAGPGPPEGAELRESGRQVSPRQVFSVGSTVNTCSVVLKFGLWRFCLSTWRGLSWPRGAFNTEEHHHGVTSESTKMLNPPFWAVSVSRGSVPHHASEQALPWR